MFRQRRAIRSCAGQARPGQRVRSFWRQSITLIFPGFVRMRAHLAIGVPRIFRAIFGSATGWRVIGAANLFAFVLREQGARLDRVGTQARHLLPQIAQLLVFLGKLIMARGSDCKQGDLQAIKTRRSGCRPGERVISTHLSGIAIPITIRVFAVNSEVFCKEPPSVRAAALSWLRGAV